MMCNKMFYALILFTSFIAESVLTLDKVEGQAFLWFNEYVKDLEDNEKIELYNGMNDLGIFVAYQALAQKKISHIVRLTTLINATTVDEEGEIIKALSYLINDLASEYPIRINYETRVDSFYQQCQKNIKLNEALNAFLSDFKNFIKQETKEPSSLLVLQLEKVNSQILNCINTSENIRQKAGLSHAIARHEFREELMRSYYECQSIIAKEINCYVIEACEAQTIFNTIILFYMDTIIKKVDL